MIRAIAAVCLVGACGWASAQKPLEPAEIKKLAQGLGDATIKGEYDKVIDSTHDGLVKMLGGRDKAIEATKTAMKGVAEKGVTISKYTVGDPGEQVTEGANTFTVLTTVTELKAPVGKIVSKGYLLGISADGGKTWKFADGAGLQNAKVRETALPKLPEKLKLPEPSKPEVVKD
jgi:hypothetical protein